jgi:hypothetical protein
LPVSSPSTLEVGFFSFILFFSFFVKIVLVIGRKMDRGLCRVDQIASQT